MSNTMKIDYEVMNLLNLSEISRVICDTNMGTLKLRIRKGEKEYRFVLDSVELDKDTNKELFEILYPSVIVPASKLTKESMDNLFESVAKPIKPKGRPKGKK